jgi:hypothetical protein
MLEQTKWTSLSGAAAYLDVSTDTIGRRAIPFVDGMPRVPGMVRYKLLKLGENTRKERRYSVDDLDALLEIA